jgi:hypothetical protein
MKVLIILIPIYSWYDGLKTTLFSLLENQKIENKVTHIFNNDTEEDIESSVKRIYI